MNVGVVFGRFQVASLHEGHIALISAVLARSHRVIVAVGVRDGAAACAKNPLPYFCREDAIRSVFPQVAVVPLTDYPGDDARWSVEFDRVLAAMAPMGKVTIYGGRDSSLGCYTGKHQTEQLDIQCELSGTQLREAIHLGASAEFRMGLIYATRPPLRYPTSYQAVDIAVLSSTHKGNVLLGAKNSDRGLWRFPGGMVDPTDQSLEMAALRELGEECGLSLTVTFPRYIGSDRVADRRYAGSPDQIMSALFRVECLWGTPQAGSDLHDARWFELDEVEQVLIPTHLPLLKRLKDSL